MRGAQQNKTVCTQLNVQNKNKENDTKHKHAYMQSGFRCITYIAALRNIIKILIHNIVEHKP